MLNIAIDGPGGAGKSTIAKAVARELNIDYIDTGAMYRAVAYKTLLEEVDPENNEQLKNMLKNTDIDFSGGDIILDGQTVNSEIREPQVTKLASLVSRNFDVRAKLVELQRNMASNKSVVMDGRDIGTNVLPDANCKFYMNASAQERAKRRYDELKLKGKDIGFDEVLNDINERDRQDIERKLNPLRKADDALEIDTTGLSINEVTDLLLSKIKAVMD